MSMKTLCIWIIVAGVLGAGVLVIRARQASAMLSGPIATSRTIGFDPSSAVGIEVVGDDGRQILERDPERPDRWLIHWTDGGMDQSWVASSSKARGGLRALATARVMLSEADLVETIGGEVTIRKRDGDVIRVVFGAGSSGGYQAVRVEERDGDGVASGRWFGRVETSVFDTFVGKGMLGWRSDRLFEITNSAVRSVELEAMGASVTLGQTNTGWVIEQPIQIHGQRTTIEDLVKVLLSLESETFVDGEIDSQTTGITNPIAKVKIATTDETASLTIGTRADINGESVYAQVESATGSALITLATDQLSKLTAAVEAYISKTPSPASSGTIASVRINGRDGIERFIASRTMGNWMIDGKQADSINRDAVDRLVGVLARDEASFVRLFETDAVPTAMGYVELLNADGSVLDGFGVALDSTEAGMRVLIFRELSNGQIVLWASESEAAMATGAWLTAVAGKRVRSSE